jgi:hypothetical protein
MLGLVEGMLQGDEERGAKSAASPSMKRRIGIGGLAEIREHHNPDRPR